MITAIGPDNSFDPGPDGQLARKLTAIDEKASLRIGAPTFEKKLKMSQIGGSDVMDDSCPSGIGICQSREVVTSAAKERSS